MPSSYEAGKLEYGYLKVEASGEQEIVWAGVGDLSLSSEVAEAAGGAAGSLSLVRMLYKSFHGEGSLKGVGAYNSSNPYPNPNHDGPNPDPHPHAHPNPNQVPTTRP